MKVFVHLIAAFVLLMIAFIIQIVTQHDSNVTLLDTVKLFSLKKQIGDPLEAANLVLSPNTWLSSSCQALTNLSLDLGCLAARQGLVKQILASTQCNVYKSQACSYINKVMTGLVSNISVVGANNITSYVLVGKNLVGAQKNLATAIQHAAYLFHGSFKATQSSWGLVIRSVLFTLIPSAILGNLLGHIADWGWSPMEIPGVIGRILFVLIPFVLAIVYSLVIPGCAIIMLIVTLPAFVILIWYEFFLPVDRKAW